MHIGNTEIFYFIIVQPTPEQIMDFSLQRLIVPGSENSRCGTFAPCNFRTLELSLPGTFAPWNFRSLEL